MPHKPARRNTSTCAPLTPDFSNPVPQSCANCARLQSLALTQDARYLAQAKVLNEIKALLKVSGQLGLTPSALGRPARKGKL
jgi:hypothetical protein